MKLKQILPTTYLLIAVIVMLILNYARPVTQLIPTPWNLLGLLPLGFGLWINIVADRAFHQAQTTVKPFEEPTALITDGAFAISRNPMYLGFVLILVGAATLLGSLTPFLVILPFCAWIDRGYVSFEEQALAEAFGAGWSKYKESTRRWL